MGLNFVFILFSVLLYFVLHIVTQGFARCLKIPLDGGQILGQVEVQQESGQNQETRWKITVTCDTGDDSTRMVVAVLLFHQLCVITRPRCSVITQAAILTGWVPRPFGSVYVSLSVGNKHVLRKMPDSVKLLFGVVGWVGPRNCIWWDPEEATENAGKGKCSSGKCEKWKMQHKVAVVENVGKENMRIVVTWLRLYSAVSL